ncbi:MAG TPA: (2Fe-2S)-binding protein [Thermoanaerobaculia bacterium]|nr:(2Fe-2S)-binding protein [Thermoanaerobaculia bacterium]
MSSCCTHTGCSSTLDAASDLCPACGAKGISVDPITLKALLTPDGLRRGVPPDPRYCPNANCQTVYFDRAAGVVFRETDLIVPVHAKQPDSDVVPVCYCFGYTEQSIRDEMERTGASTATTSITAEVKAGRCACEVKNPKGSCCLGDVARVERRIASRLTLTTS